MLCGQLPSHVPALARYINWQSANPRYRMALRAALKRRSCSLAVKRIKQPAQAKTGSNIGKSGASPPINRPEEATRTGKLGGTQICNALALSSSGLFVAFCFNQPTLRNGAAAGYGNTSELFAPSSFVALMHSLFFALAVAKPRTPARFSVVVAEAKPTTSCGFVLHGAG